MQHTLRNLTLLKIFSACMFTGLVALLSMAGCSRDTGNGITGPQSNSDLTSAKTLAQSNVGPIRILSVNQPARQSLKKDDDEETDSLFYVEKFIKRKKGGEVKLGNKQAGKSKLKFEKYSLPQDLTISFSWAAGGTVDGMLNNLQFGPHGTYFDKPVEVELSYKMADLTGINEDSLRIFYYNDSLGVWKLIGGQVDKNKKKIKGKLHHFSRYAVAISR